MSYSNYDLAIRSSYKVELHGWPLGIKFTSPSNVSALAEIKILHEAIKSGECTWMAINRAQVAELAEKTKGELVKKRATHSDKGKKCGQRSMGKRKDKENGSDNEEQPPQKKPRQPGQVTKKLLVMPHS